MSGSNINEITMAGIYEAVGVSASTLKTLMMRVLHKCLDYEDFAMKIVESTIVPVILCKHHPQVDTPANAWVKFHSNLCDTKSGVLRH